MLVGIGNRLTWRSLLINSSVFIHVCFFEAQIPKIEVKILTGYIWTTNFRKEKRSKMGTVSYSHVSIWRLNFTRNTVWDKWEKKTKLLSISSYLTLNCWNPNHTHQWNVLYKKKSKYPNIFSAKFRKEKKSWLKWNKY
jgi:hypothetical protein